MARLSTSDDKNIEILKRIATEDASPDVRCAAISKLNDVSLLQSISATDDNEEVTDTANARISSILLETGANSAPLAERIATLKQIRNSRVAENIASEAKEPELKIAGVEFVEDQSILSSIALSGDSAALRQAAARQINDHDVLHSLANVCKHHDKNVYRIAREKLAIARDEARESSEGMSRKMHLLESMELLAKSAYSTLYSAKYQQLASQWAALAKRHTPELEPRFAQAKLVCEKTISQHDEQELEQQKHIEQSRIGHEQRLDLCHSAESMLDDLMHSTYTGEPSATELQALLNHYRTRWKSTATESLPTQQEQKRFNRAAGSLDNFILAVQRLEKKLAGSNELLDQAARLLNKENFQQLDTMQRTRSSLEQIIAQIAWPESFPPSAELNQATEAARDLHAAIDEARKNQTRTLQLVKDKLEQLSAHIDEGEVKSASGLRGDIRGLIKQLGNKKTAAIGKQFANLSNKLDELNDWKNFAATPKKEQLIEKMEGLVESDLPLQDRANLIRKLETEWKSLGRGGKDRAESDELWARFKQAADSAYEPCKAYFASMREQRKENLRQRKAICDELEKYVAATNWEEVDWKKVEKIVHLGRDEWRKFSPVDRATGKKVQQRFDQLIGGINDRLKDERNANARLKQDLVNQMQTLVELEDLRTAISEAKQLQKAWSNIGITHRSDDRRLWKEFRSACDQIFDRRNQENQARDQERNEQLRLAEALCEKLEQAAETDLSGWDDSAIHLNELSNEFNSLGPMDREKQSAIQIRFEQAVARYRERCRQHDEYLEEQKAANARSISDRCADIENRVMSGDIEVPEAEFEQLRAELDTSALDRNFISAIRSRMDKAANSRGNPQQLLRQLDDNLKTLRLLCVRLEVLTGKDSPAEDQELRMRYQVNRLSEGMMGESGESESTLKRQSELTLEWLAIGPVELQAKSALQNRWDRAIGN